MTQPAQPGDDAQAVEDLEPIALRLIFDVETMRVVAEPLRARILETMAGRPTGSWSANELAEALGVPQTRLYHHLALLVQHHLIRAVERRVVSRIVQTRYRVVARSIQLDPGLFAADRPDRAADAVGPEAVFDRGRADVAAAIAAGTVDLSEGAPPERRLILDRVVMSLAPERAAALRERLFALADEFGEDAAIDGIPTGMVLAVYPMAPESTGD